MTYNFKATMLMILKALRGFRPADADGSAAVSDMHESLSCARSDVMNRKISPRNQENVSRTDFRQLYPLFLCIRFGCESLTAALNAAGERTPISILPFTKKVGG